MIAPRDPLAARHDELRDAWDDVIEAIIHIPDEALRAQAREAMKVLATVALAPRPPETADPVAESVNEAWKALIATGLRRNVVVAVGEHRAAVEAAIRGQTDE